MSAVESLVSNIEFYGQRYWCVGQQGTSSSHTRLPLQVNSSTNEFHWLNM